MEKSSVGYLSNPLCRRRPHVAVGQFLTIIQTLAHTQSAKTAPLRWRRARHVTHHLASWATVCPGNNESAGKRKNGRTRPGNRWLRATLTPTGWAGAADKKSLFQFRYQRLKLRRGGQRAVMAIAHAQLIAIYWALRNGTPYPEQLQKLEQDRREAQIRYHLQKLNKLGYAPDMHG